MKAAKKSAVKRAKAAAKPAAKAAAKPTTRPGGVKAPALKTTTAGPAPAKAAAPRRPAEAAGSPQPVDPARLGRLLELRLKQRAAEFSQVKARFERVAHALQELVVSAGAEPAKAGPRRFRPAPSQAREYQQQITELGTELRLITARRAELIWLQQQLTGSGPELPAALRELIASRRKPQA